MPDFDDLQKPPSICLHPGGGADLIDFVDLTDDGMPFARAAVLFSIGLGPLEDVIREGHELEALREWRKSREQLAIAALADAVAAEPATDQQCSVGGAAQLVRKGGGRSR